ncbi:Clavesin-1 [Eumeta japonica]|uniref:Clavesin-1 n=1 Tax=Eumeta variegata TaxID=151549 RepID=A0A4C1U662_EUMVA|nr:Clavesin-1 [Eumeta japonica]
MSFLDVVLQAEVSRYEDADFAEHALRYCDEQLDSRDEVIKSLRNMIFERGEFKPRRTDDAYLLRFLRARRFIPKRAHRMMARYEEFRRKNQYLYRDVDIFKLTCLKGVYEGIVPDSPVWGRICILRFANWNPAEVPTEDLLRLSILMCEIGVMQPRLQILGFTIIIDLEGFSVQHARHFNTDIIKQLIYFTGGACPITLRGIHIINSSWLFNTLFNMTKPFLPAAAWDILYFHGSGPNSLRRHIDRVNLPPRYGGACQYVVPSELWLTKIKKYKDDFLTEELRALGYIVKD